MSDSRIEHVTCLGCGCGCDDIAVTVRDGRIVQTDPPCPVSRKWFGDGSVPWQVLRNGKPAGLEEAVSEAANLLVRTRGRLLVYIGSDLSSQAQRGATTLADLLRATLDTATSDTAAAGLLAAQRRGRATATLGEIRNRADVLLFWGTDPSRRYPRFQSRYAMEPAGIQIPNGRAGRFAISVNIGRDKGPPGADATLSLEPADEIAVLSLMRAALLGRPAVNLTAPFKAAVDLVPRLTAARYAVLVHDAEPTEEPRNPLRIDGLIALAQALNGPTRAALCTLRAGGNSPGGDAVLTYQTGYPFAVDYSRGYPRYMPETRGLSRLESGGFRGALVVGSPSFDARTASALDHIETVVIGPRASQAPFKAKVAIDTGVAGIHEDGVGYRMDEVPLRLRAPLQGQRSTVATLAALSEAIQAMAGPV
jgi:formylmethanofuran dehydrogenase subunit B